MSSRGNRNRRSLTGGLVAVLALSLVAALMLAGCPSKKNKAGPGPGAAAKASDPAAKAEPGTAGEPGEKGEPAQQPGGAPQKWEGPPPKTKLTVVKPMLSYIKEADESISEKNAMEELKKLEAEINKE